MPDKVLFLADRKSIRWATITEDALTEDPSGGDHTVEDLMPRVYSELRALAAQYLGRGASGHTLQPTALVNEAFIRLESTNSRWPNREHFLAVAAKAMRHVLVDHARAKNCDKRGGGWKRVDLGVVADTGVASEGRLRVIELDDLLRQLAEADPRSAGVAEMILFGGMEQDEVARVVGVSRGTVSTDWRFARAWLASRITEPDRAKGPDHSAGGSVSEHGAAGKDQ